MVESSRSKEAPGIAALRPCAKGLPFSLVSDLLEKCGSSLDRKTISRNVIEWFEANRDRIESPDCNLAALLSTLLPEKRTDRVYSIQTPRLERIIISALCLGKSRQSELRAYKEPGRGLDLADCVERVLNQTPNPIQPEGSQITVEDIDEVLHGIASKIRWSSPSIRASDSTMNSCTKTDLTELYRQLSPREAKWFTRLVLKNFQPLIFNSGTIYHSCHRMLPPILKIRDDFNIAIQALQQVRLSMQSRVSTAPSGGQELLATIKPQLSVKVGRQLWVKARSIKHCLSLYQGRMSVETKMDGEYCQIHIDISKGGKGFQIFSKSGKDSTEDRRALQDFVFESLRIGQRDCPIKQECILEGELLVYSDLEQKILPFHHIRNHVTRRGRLINADYDSRPRPGEHVMIVYYDILLLDGKSLLNAKHSERFEILKRTIHCSRGRAEIVQRQIIDTGHELGASSLRNAFKKIIRAKGEGLVLKADLPYFKFSDKCVPFTGRCIKLKKEYIGNFGDVGDFAVVGAGFNPQKAKSYDIPNLKWTHFFIGCLDNKEEVKRWGVKPKFTIVNEIELNATMLKTFIAHGGIDSVPEAENEKTIFKRNKSIEVSASLITAFKDPPIFDIRCFGFEKMADTGFWGLRFPTATKIHFDRDFSDAISFDELQELAEEATSAPEVEDSQENLEWIAKLEAADPRGVAVDASTQETATTGPSPSPVRPSPAAASCPPTSSISSPQGHRGQDLQRGKHSLSQGSDITPSRPPKRCQRRALAVQNGAYPASKREHPSRRPLEEIDPNSTQGSQQSFSTSTPLSAFSFSESQAELQEDPNRVAPPKSLVIEEIGNDNPASQPVDVGETRPSTALRTKLDDLNSPKPAPHALGACKLAGSKCHLADKVILVDSSIQEHSPEFAALLEDHGLTKNLADPESWAKEDRLRSLSTKEWRPGKSPFLLVDGLKRPAETKSLISAMEEIRKDIPDADKTWIGVFDWRVLKHISILEDDGIEKKYYDGFRSPWVRWQFGLI